MHSRIKWLKSMRLRMLSQAERARVISAFVQQWLVAFLALGIGYGLGGGKTTWPRGAAVGASVWVIVFLVSLLPLPSPLDFVLPLGAGALAAWFLLRVSR